MIFLDSWIWIEYFTEGNNKPEVEKILDETENEGGVISTLALLETKYRLLKQFGKKYTEKLMLILKSDPALAILPVTEEVAELGASLREKYYSKKTTFSYNDSIMLATAMLSGCKKLCTGDSDFKDVDEIDVQIL